MNRFGEKSFKEIENAITDATPKNSIKTRASIWTQFDEFCEERKYKLLTDTTTEQIANNLQDWGFNMKRKNGDDYKESCIKTMWNTTAKMIQEKYFNEYGRVIDPFADIVFKSARQARDAKRKGLQECAEKRKVSSQALFSNDIQHMANAWNEENPEGLQRHFFHICAFELAWRGKDAVNCKMYYFRDEIDVDGKWTGRIEYNPIFSKTAQGSSKALTNSKWLIKNSENLNFCPVRLLKLLLGKRDSTIKLDRLFLCSNSNWKNGKWYKDLPIGINTLSKWTRESAEKVGLKTKRLKISNHSHRASAVSSLAKKGVGERQLVKITGHAHTNSIKSYLQSDTEHHFNLIQNLRNFGPSSTVTSASAASCDSLSGSDITDINKSVSGLGCGNYYNNCVFNIYNK